MVTWGVGWCMNYEFMMIGSLFTHSVGGGGVLVEFCFDVDVFLILSYVIYVVL